MNRSSSTGNKLRRIYLRTSSKFDSSFFWYHVVPICMKLTCVTSPFAVGHVIAITVITAAPLNSSLKSSDDHHHIYSLFNCLLSSCLKGESRESDIIMNLLTPLLPNRTWLKSLTNSDKSLIVSSLLSMHLKNKTSSCQEITRICHSCSLAQKSPHVTTFSV